MPLPRSAPNTASWTLNRQYRRRLMSRSLYTISPLRKWSHQTNLSWWSKKASVIVFRTSQLNMLKAKDQKIILRKDRTHAMRAVSTKDCRSIWMINRGCKLSKPTSPSWMVKPVQRPKVKLSHAEPLNLNLAPSAVLGRRIKTHSASISSRTRLPPTITFWSPLKWRRVNNSRPNTIIYK